MLWLAVASQDAQRGNEVLQAHADAQLDEAGRRAASTVIDLDAETSECPACTGTIPQGSARCPECGLRFG
ncbi:MAG: hypothetical protein GY711_26520 [bacterium]|nr:hypothetical protein [bacterium]